MCQLLGEARANREIIRIFAEMYRAQDGTPFQLWHSQVQWFKTHPKWRAVVEEYRRVWNEAISEIAITHLRIKLEMLDEAARRGLEWLFDGDTLVYMENEAFDPTKAVSRANPPYFERRVPRYKCHPEWTIRAVELAAEIQHGRRIKHELMGEGGGEIKGRMTVFPAEPVSLAEWEKFYKLLTNGGGGGAPEAGNPSSSG